MGTTGPRAQPFTNTLARQSPVVATPSVLAAYRRRRVGTLSPFSLYLIARVPARNPPTNMSCGAFHEVPIREPPSAVDAARSFSVNQYARSVSWATTR
jgi:hypothetical protein